jgi:hypothetical protein
MAAGRRSAASGQGRREQRAITPEQVAEQVAEQVRRIGAHSGDDETASSMERQLYLAVIAAIADGHPSPQELALAAIQSQRWGFDRGTE